jgi:hypothetical protein
MGSDVAISPPWKAISESWHKTMPARSAEQVAQEAEELLQTAYFGLADLRGKPERRSGLRNAVVFGRNTTWALQNLRHIVPGFDDWYAPIHDTRPSKRG